MPALPNCWFVDNVEDACCCDFYDDVDGFHLTLDAHGCEKRTDDSKFGVYLCKREARVELQTNVSV